MKNKMLIRDGYNQITRSYLTERLKLRTGKYVQQLMRLLPKGGMVLDVGCGAGVPVDDELIKHGFSVIGIDISEEQIKLARKLCKGGDYRVADMTELDEGDYKVDAVACLYAMFHVPREEQARLLRILASYLPVGGHLLITMGDKDFEGEHQLMGVTMWSSQWGPAKNSQMVAQAGFTILVDEMNTSASERHQVILAVKK